MLLTVLSVMGYWFTLLVFSVIAHSRGNTPWSSTVRDHTFLAPATGASAIGGATSYQMSQAQPAVQSHYTESTQNASTTAIRRAEYQNHGYVANGQGHHAPQSNPQAYPGVAQV
jgi:hypothetical protein